MNIWRKRIGYWINKVSSDLVVGGGGISGDCGGVSTGGGFQSSDDDLIP